MAQIQQQIVTVAFTKVWDDDGTPTFVAESDIKDRLNTANIATFLFTTSTVIDVTNSANITFSGTSLSVTGVYGTGSVATLTFSTQTTPPFTPGQIINVSNVISSTLDGLRTVVSCSNNEVQVASTAIPTYTIGNSLLVTGVSGTGTIASLTYATQGSAPFTIGDEIAVAGLTPVAYNTVFLDTQIATVLSANTTTVTYSSAASGSTNFVSGAGVVSKYIPAYVSGAGTVSEAYL
jgi:hypothetical protein